MRRPYLLFSLSAWSAVLLFSTVAACAGDQKKEATPMTVSNGKQVTLEYTLKLDDQSVVDTNVGGEPLKVTQGGRKSFQGSALDGMAVGEKKEIHGRASRWIRHR